MKQPSLLLTTFMLFGVALVSVLALGPLGLDIRWSMAPKVGLTCGLLSCGIATWLRGRPMARRAAPAVMLLSLTAVALAGPTVGFLLAFGFATGLGSLFALIGAGSQEGMEGVGLNALYLLALATVMALSFICQAWAIVQARQAWTRCC